MAIRELGSLLKHECLWMPMAVLKASTIKTIRGQWLQCLRVLLRSMLMDEHNVREGVHIPDLGLIFMRLSNILGDADALRQCWSAKGSSGTMPTLEALNVCNNRHMSLAPYDPSGTFVTIAETNMDKIHFATNDDIWYKSDLLQGMVASGAFSQAAIKAKETSIGLNANINKDLTPLVRPMDCNTHDSTHIFFSDGLCNTELDLLLPKLVAKGITFTILRNFMAADFRRP